MRSLAAASRTSYVMDMSLLDNEKAKRSDLDSHADTTVGGANTVVIEPTGQTVSISPFSGEYDPMDAIPIANIGTVYDCPTTGMSHLLVFHESLFLGDRLGHSLICPNQQQQSMMSKNFFI